jgi:8-oxo-dGTP pyrophosphatase MutT (NUDIX family)
MSSNSLIHAAGGVVVIADPFDGIIMVVEQKPARFRLPKGMLDIHETSEQAAIREVWEETGAVVEIVESLGTAQWSYQYEGQTLDKHVDFYLMRAMNWTPGHVDDHVRGVAIMALNLAEEMLYHESEREMVRRALTRSAGPYRPGPRS